jgi:aspartyl-tRNA(Asn)/glutamyl-tRNA(Gln) amidotransferase subunit C
MQPPTFTRDAIGHLAALASLSLSDEEADSLAKDLRSIVAYVEELGAVDTSEVSPTPAVAPTAAEASRADVLLPGLPREEALRGAPRTSEGCFAVPAFVSSDSAGPSRGAP